MPINRITVKILQECRIERRLADTDCPLPGWPEFLIKPFTAHRQEAKRRERQETIKTPSSRIDRGGFPAMPGHAPCQRNVIGRAAEEKPDRLRQAKMAAPGNEYLIPKPKSGRPPDSAHPAGEQAEAQRRTIAEARRQSVIIADLRVMITCGGRKGDRQLDLVSPQRYLSGARF